MLVTISLLDADALHLLPILLGTLFGYFLSEKEKGGGYITVESGKIKCNLEISSKYTL